MFAKVFETKSGQLLVFKSTDDSGAPSVRHVFEFSNGAQVERNPIWNDDDDGWSKRDEYFGDFTQEMADKFVLETRDRFQDFMV